MKFASRISSIRRHAWKQCRSCSADSDSMWLRLVRELGARRVDPLAARLEHGGDRMLREPVDLEVRVQLAQLVGDRDVAPRVAEPDRRRDVERALAARPAARHACRRRRRRDEVAQEEVDLDRVARVRRVARALEADERRRRSARRARRPTRASGSRRRAPWITSTGQRTRAGELARRSPRRAPGRAASRSASPASSRSPQPTQSSIGLVECGSVKICEKKNSRKSA